MAEGLASEARRLQRLCSEAVAAPSPSRPTSTTTKAVRVLSKRSNSEAGSSTEAWELALEAWLDCRPQGYVLEEKKVKDLLPDIEAHVPRPNGDSPGAANQPDPRQLFVPASKGAEPVFLTLLRAHSGKVHFLYFWKAFGEAVHMAGACVEEGLAVELEILRDRVLRRLEEEALQPGGRGRSGSGSSSSSSGTPLRSSFEADEQRVLPTWALVEEVHRAASMSAYPRFWQRSSETLSGQLELKELSLEELTSVLLSWLHDSQLWEQQQKIEAQEQLKRTTSTSESSPASSIAASPSDAADNLAVHLHIYDVSQEEGIQKLNRILAHKNSPLKFGGVFHAGVEVNGLEWSYGYSPSESRPGVACVEPRQHPQHHYRQTVILRHTEVRAEAIAEIISQLIEEYPGSDYNLLRRNCCHFADEFCRRLGVGGIPGWVHRLARLGAGVDTMLQNAPRPIKERIYG